MAARKPIRRSQVSSVQRPDNDDPQDDDLNTDVEDNTDDDTDIDTEGSDDESNGDDTPPVDPETETPATPEEPQERMMGAPRDGRVFRAGEPIVFKGTKRGGVIISDEHIYRGVRAPGSTRFRFHQVLRKGAEVPSGKCKEVTKGEYQTNTPF